MAVFYQFKRLLWLSTDSFQKLLKLVPPLFYPETRFLKLLAQNERVIGAHSLLTLLYLDNVQYLCQEFETFIQSVYFLVCNFSSRQVKPQEKYKMS